MRNATAPNPPSFAALVQQFFTDHLVTQRAVSPRVTSRGESDCLAQAVRG